MKDCIFCRIASGGLPSWKIHETGDALAFLDINPASKYHTLVIPKQHYTSVFDAPSDILKSVMQATKEVVDIYSLRLGLRNIQIVSSSGAEAQQDVPHLHFHIVPRRKGDGQDIRWTIHPELRQEFGEMLKTLELHKIDETTK